MSALLTPLIAGTTKFVITSQADLHASVQTIAMAKTVLSVSNIVPSLIAPKIACGISKN